MDDITSRLFRHITTPTGYKGKKVCKEQSRKKKSERVTVLTCSSLIHSRETGDELMVRIFRVLSKLTSSAYTVFCILFACFFVVVVVLDDVGRVPAFVLFLCQANVLNKIRI